MLNEFLTESLFDIGSASPQPGRTVDHITDQADSSRSFITVISNGVVVVPSSFRLLPLLLQQMKDGTGDLTLFIGVDDAYSDSAALLRNDRGACCVGNLIQSDAEKS